MMSLHIFTVQMLDMETWSDENEDDFIVLADENETSIGMFLYQ